MDIGFIRGGGIGAARKEIESNKNLSVMSRSFPMLIRENNCQISKIFKQSLVWSDYLDLVKT